MVEWGISLGRIVRSNQFKMQVPNVLDALRQGDSPQFNAPVQWTDRMSEWRDDLELYDRLMQLYKKNPTPENALHWSGFVDSLRPIDWQTFGEFFTLCPRASQTPAQQEVTNAKCSVASDIAAMQLLQQLSKKTAKLDPWIRKEGSMQHLELPLVSNVVQHVWEHSSGTIVSKHLPERLYEFFKHFPHVLQEDQLPQGSAALLMSTIIVGSDIGSISFAEDIDYYQRACANAALPDVVRWLDCLAKNRQWIETIEDTHEMRWFEPFVQPSHPHASMFQLYQSLCPEMRPKQLAHFLHQHTQPAPESYTLESLNLS